MKCEIEIIYNYNDWGNINDISESFMRLKDTDFIQNVIRASNSTKSSNSSEYKLDFNWGCESLIVSILI